MAGDCALPAMALIALFLSGSGQLLAGITPAVMAAGRSANIAQNECTSTHQEPSFGGTIVVETNEIACGNLTAFGGTVAINGEVRGDIVAFTSSVVIAGTVDGNIQLYGGRVILQSGSPVFGDIHLYAGQVVEGLNARLEGSVIDHTKRVDWLFTDNGAFRFSFLVPFDLGGAGHFAYLCTARACDACAYDRGQQNAAQPCYRSLERPIAPAVLIVLIALVLSIPLAIIVGLGLVAAWALGTVAVGWLVGDYIMRRVAPQHNTRLIQIVVGLTALVLAGSLPYIGWLISIGVGLLGLGAVFLSRFGTRLYSQPKQPLIL